MRVVYDANVVLDVLAARQPFVQHSKAALRRASAGEVEGALTANTITDIACLLLKHVEGGQMRPALMGLLEFLDIAQMDFKCCMDAVNRTAMSDFEHAVLAEAALHWDAEYIVTRDTKGFANSPVPAVSPEEFLREG